jgi:hypothetical protein
MPAPEGFNSVIQRIKANARGFRGFANYRARILFLGAGWIWGGLEIEQKITGKSAKNLSFQCKCIVCASCHPVRELGCPTPSAAMPSAAQTRNGSP